MASQPHPFVETPRPAERVVIHSSGASSTAYSTALTTTVKKQSNTIATPKFVECTLANSANQCPKPIVASAIKTAAVDRMNTSFCEAPALD